MSEVLFSDVKHVIIKKCPGEHKTTCQDMTEALEMVRILPNMRLQREEYLVTGIMVLM